MKEKYSLHSRFSLEQHKKAFQDYLEVIIDRNGTIMYATPSHQEKLIQMACEQEGWTRDHLMDVCPKRFHYDFMTWLLLLTESVSVWNGHCLAPAPNKKHIAALRSLKMGGVYHGDVPRQALVPPPKEELLAEDGRPIWQLLAQIKSGEGCNLSEKKDI